MMMSDSITNSCPEALTSDINKCLCPEAIRSYQIERIASRIVDIALKPVLEKFKEDCDNINANIDLVKILKEHKGEIFYSRFLGRVEVIRIGHQTISVRQIGGSSDYVLDSEGKFSPEGEMDLFPSKECRDWNEWQKTHCLRNWRANEGENFYIITNLFKIVKVTERNEECDDTIYEIGNYFESEEEAKNVANMLQNLIKDYHSKKNQEKRNDSK